MVLQSRDVYAEEVAILSGGGSFTNCHSFVSTFWSVFSRDNLLIWLKDAFSSSVPPFAWSVRKAHDYEVGWPLAEMPALKASPCSPQPAPPITVLQHSSPITACLSSLPQPTACIESQPGNFPGDLVVKNPPCNEGDVGLIPGQGTKVHTATKPACCQLLSSRATGRESLHTNKRFCMMQRRSNAAK